MNRIGLVLVLALSLATSGCWFGSKRPQKPATPPAPAPIKTPTHKTAPIDPPPDTLPSKPVQSLPDMAPAPATPSATDTTPPPKPPAKPTTRKSAKRTTPATNTPPAAQAPATQLPAPAAQPVPQLSVLLTNEQRNQYEAEYTRDMASAMDGLVHVLEHSLSPAQKESMTRIRSFMRQAEDAHGRDLATAAQLAKRAAVLAQDLVQSQR